MDLKLKSKPRRTVETLALALVGACSISVASASVTYQVNNGGLESFNVKIDSTVINGALAGGILINRVAGDSSMPSSYVTVCTDIQGTLYLGQSYQYETPVTPFSGQTGIAPTWGIPANGSAAAEAIQNAAYLFYTYGQLTGSGIGLSSTTMKAALQLAVWEALYNTTTGGDIMTSGSTLRFKVTGGADQAAINQANAWIAALNNLNDEGNFGLEGYLLTPYQGKNHWHTDGRPPQGLLFGVVPEAPTVIAGVLLLLPFAASTLKILRKKHTT